MVPDYHYYHFFPSPFLLSQRVKYVQYSQPDKLSERDEERLNAWLNTHNRSLCSRLPELSCEENLIETKDEDEGNSVKRSVATMQLQFVIFSARRKHFIILLENAANMGLRKHPLFSLC